jgi:hypothetical protein
VAERLLVPGVDVSRGPQLKFQRGLELLDELDTMMDAWGKLGLVRVETVISTEPNQLDFVMRVQSVPPVEKWSLLFGEAVHAFRSGFDQAASDFARLDGAAPLKPKRVYFPFAETLADWARQTRDLESVPSDLMERIRAFQPFGDPDPSKNLLLTLHELDIRDKHNGLILAHPYVRSLKIAGASIYLDVGDTIEPFMLPGPVEFVDGTLIGGIRFGQPIKNLSPFKPSGETGFELVIEHRDETLNLQATCAMLKYWMPALLHFLYSGETPPD